jgi:hypothetical protein
MNFKEELISARQRVEIYRSRYAGKDDSYDPIHIAIEWQKLFESSQPNVDDARKLVAVAIESQNKFDISFFTFCNHMEKILKQMVKDSLIQ